MTIHQGSCYCGSVQYQIDDEPKRIVNCHCKLCRAHSGTSLSTYAIFLYKNFTLIQGESLLKSHCIDLATKHFCRQCGTPIYNLNARYPNACMVFIGTLENFEGYQPEINIWWDSQLDWIGEIQKIRSIAEGI